MRSMAELCVGDWHRLNRLLEAGLTLGADARAALLQRLPAIQSDLLPLLQRPLSPQAEQILFSVSAKPKAAAGRAPSRAARCAR
jgi:hypothetical protein